MNRRLAASCVVFLGITVGLILPQAARAEESYSVTDVSVEGNRRIDSAAIRAQLPRTTGHFSKSEISDGVKALYRTGFFDDVSANVVQEKRGAVLQFSVVERPAVRKVFIKGNKGVSEGDLSEVLSFDAKRFFEPSKLTQMVRNAVTLYQGRGFYDAAITYSVVPAGDGLVDLTFQVTEGVRYRIKGIKFRGSSKIDPDELRTVIETKRYKWWSSWLLGTGRLNQAMLDNDRVILRQYFLDHGYLDAGISEPVIEKVDEKHLKVMFDINEGSQYHVGALGVKGDLVSGGEAKTLEGIVTKTGAIFNASDVRKDSFTITDKFGDEGYAFANVVPQMSVDKGAGVVNLQFEAARGELTKVNRINITGNTKTYDHVIRREIKLREQDQYSGTKVKRSETLLQRLGYFDQATISTKPTAAKDKVDLDVNVREGNTGTFSIGAGYSTSDGAIFTSKLAEQNILGTGRKLELDVDVGTQKNNIVFSVDDPRLNDSHVSGGTDLYITNRHFNDFDRELEGAGLTFGYPLEELLGEWWEDVAVSLKYEYTGVDITSVDVTNAAELVINSQGRSTASGITPKITRNTINNPLNPTRGSRQSLSAELTGLGGDQDFYIISLKNTSYLPLASGDWGDLVFSYRGALDYGESLNNEPLPLFRRFFAGGINSVRGYNSRSLGPHDSKGHSYGGSKEFVNNFELIFPLVRSAGLNAVTFFDIGDSFDDNQSIDISKLRKGYGAGIRWNSPIGPLRLEFGFPLNRQGDESSMVTMFSFGAPF